MIEVGARWKTVRFWQPRRNSSICSLRGIEFQQNIAKFRIGIIVVHVPKNQIEYDRAIRMELQEALTNVRLGEVVHISARRLDERQNTPTELQARWVRTKRLRELLKL
jgi:hypothetical protein